ncbi:MAG TPA: sigma-70 family RNA polymerase sigma factor [Kofleriaceae bacterium]|nr:sigma-70 family RNA polymerase sigma factor [Kofleriaceae bacterium]
MTTPIGARPATLSPELRLVRDQARDAASVEELYRRYADRVYRWALRFGAGNVAWAEDVTQDVFMGLVKRLPELHDTDDLGGWFYRITANRCLNEIRRGRFLRALVERFSTSASPDEPSSTPESVVLARSELGEALQALGALPARERVIFCMHHLDDIQQREIGEVLGCSKGHVSRLLARAEARLRRAGWRIG